VDGAQPDEQRRFRKNRRVKILGNGYSPLAYQLGTFQKSLAELIPGQHWEHATFRNTFFFLCYACSKTNSVDKYSQTWRRAVNCTCFIYLFFPRSFLNRRSLSLCLLYCFTGQSPGMWSKEVGQFGSGIARELAKSKPKLLNGGPSRSWLQTGSFPSTLVKWVQYGAILVSNSPWSGTRMRAEPSAVLFSVGSYKCKVRVRMEWIDFRKWGRTFG